MATTDFSPSALNCSITTLLASPTLGSFDPLYYLYFIVVTLLVPYPLYWLIAKRYKWEVNSKSMARHWNDIVGGLTYGCVVFTFGDYSKTLSWIQAVAFYIALFGFGLIAELPAAKQSLPSIKSWPVGMWIIFLVAIALILAFAVYHILYAVRLGGYFWIYYVCALLIPAFLLTCAILLWQEVDKNLVRTYLAKRKSQPKPKQSEQPEAGPTPTTEEAATEAAVPNPYTMKIGFHPHHWQIFYMLAFWTRFNDPVSQVAAGIVMGCYMQGVVAYGYDSILMDG